MADEATGRDLEPLAGRTSGGSVHGSQDRDSTDLASSPTANRSKSYCRAARFKTAGPLGVSRGLESGTGAKPLVPAGRRHAERDPKPNRLAGPYGCRQGEKPPWNVHVKLRV